MKSVKKRKTPYDTTYTWNLKHGTNEPIYKTEMDSEIENGLAVAKGEKGREWDGLGVWV